MDSQYKDNGKEESPPQVATSSTFSDTLPALDGARDGTYLSQFYNQPIITTLTSFSHVANLVRNPYELINNVDEFVRHASKNRRQGPRTSENFARTLNQNTSSPLPNSPILQEMDTFVASSHHDQSSSSDDPQPNQCIDKDIPQDSYLPIPALPPIECTTKRGRLEPLTIEEYENKLRLSATDFELVERVFFGGMSCNQLRASLWPYLFGLVLHRGRFEKIYNTEGGTAYLFIEHDGNTTRWSELHKLFNQYQSQWKAILPDQEMRFSTFRERKSLIERDVIRCDRLHPFYAEEPQNLATLTNLLMTYMMYDFDIGYVQGMSDLAGPILYVYNGDIVKSFWVFVEVMKLFRRNFELTQKTIHFQLNCLNKLIRITDPIFAQYLEEHESSNCFFAFRAIVCQFKRELMKTDEDDYSKVLFLWDTIWLAKRRVTLQEELKTLETIPNQSQMLEQHENNSSKSAGSDLMRTPNHTSNMTSNDENNYYPVSYDPNTSDTPRSSLTETEIFVLALCLSMIRRERDLIMANRLDGTDIHLHFIDPKLANDINAFIEHAINIYSFLKNDFDITKLTSPKEPSPFNKSKDKYPESPPGSIEGYDLLSDFLIINGASGS